MVEEEVEDGAVMRTRRRGDVGTRWRRRGRRGRGRCRWGEAIQRGRVRAAPESGVRLCGRGDGAGYGAASGMGAGVRGVRRRGMGSSPIQIPASGGGGRGREWGSWGEVGIVVRVSVGWGDKGRRVGRPVRGGVADWAGGVEARGGKGGIGLLFLFYFNSVCRICLQYFELPIGLCKNVELGHINTLQ